MRVVRVLAIGVGPGTGGWFTFRVYRPSRPATAATTPEPCSSI